MEWEASLLHKTSGAEFKQRKNVKTANKPDETDIVYTDPKTGELTTQKVDTRSWWKKNVSERTGKDVRGENELRIHKPVIAKAGMVFDPSENAYLDKCGWVDGANIMTSEIETFFSKDCIA